MAATASNIGYTSLDIASLASLLADTFLHLPKTQSQLLLHLLQSWLPQVMSRLSHIPALKSQPATPRLCVQQSQQAIGMFLSNQTGVFVANLIGDCRKTVRKS